LADNFGQFIHVKTIFHHLQEVDRTTAHLFVFVFQLTFMIYDWYDQRLDSLNDGCGKIMDPWDWEHARYSQ